MQPDLPVDPVGFGLLPAATNGTCSRKICLKGHDLGLTLCELHGVFVLCGLQALLFPMLVKEHPSESLGHGQVT